MANRVLRDYTDSEKIDLLTPNEEVFFVRLMMKADDFGSYHGNPRLLRSALFPLKSTVRETDITHWIAACEKAGLIAVYENAGKKYVRIKNFGQRLRSMKQSFPQSENESVTESADNCQRVADKSPPETKRNETRNETKRNEKRDFIPPALPDLVLYMISISGTEDDASKMFRYYQSNGWKVGKNKMANWEASAQNWLDRKKDFEKSKTNGKSKTGNDIDAVREWYDKVTGSNPSGN